MISEAQHMLVQGLQRQSPHKLDGAEGLQIRRVLERLHRVLVDILLKGKLKSHSWHICEQHARQWLASGAFDSREQKQMWQADPLSKLIPLLLLRATAPTFRLWDGADDFWPRSRHLHPLSITWLNRSWLLKTSDTTCHAHS